jgi:hypothetical protein
MIQLHMQNVPTVRRLEYGESVRVEFTARHVVDDRLETVDVQLDITDPHTAAALITLLRMAIA